MPKTLNPQNAFPTSITNFPISGNNEPIAIEPLENAIQAVLNRSENLHVRLSEAETQGVKRVRTVPSLAALSAATGFNNGDVCDVEGYGRYRLYNPSGLTADGLWVLNAAGGGRWVHTLRDMRGTGNGLATLDSSQRLAQDVRDASILTQHIANQGVTAAKLAPGSVVEHLGYTPVNKAGDTMTGQLVVPSLRIGDRRLLHVHVDQGSDTATRYYLLARVDNIVGILAIQGILVGQSAAHGRANVNLQITVRDGLRVDGYILGNPNASDILIVDGGDGFAYVYLITKTWALVNLELSTVPVAHILYDDTYSTTAPTGTQLYLLSDDYNNNAHPHTLKLRDGNLVVAGQITGRVEFSTRFIVQGQLGGTTSMSMASNTYYGLSQINIYISSGKRLYLKRLRYQFSSSPTAYVSCQGYSYTGSLSYGDISIDVAMSNIGAVNVTFFISAYNPTSDSVSISPADSVWAELEIR